ncbi:MAG: hypothetical protein M1831_001015 [Alyxoria varia]|nr:MAG: hypothetical protein M1831_001015 [Alyxoria varia]
MAGNDRNKGAKITVHWLNKSRAQRLLAFLEELGLTYDIELYERGSDRLAPASLKEVHPLGKSPLLTIEAPAQMGESEPRKIVLAESAAIFEYLCDHYGEHLIPARWSKDKDGNDVKALGSETAEWMRYRYFMHYAEGTLMPLLVLLIVVNTIRNAPVPFFLKPIVRTVASKIESSYLSPNLTLNFAFLEDQLKTSPDSGKFFCGANITAADFMLEFPVGAAAKEDIVTKEQHPLLVEYIDRMKERESYQQAGDRIKKDFGSDDDENMKAVG